jgi:hypothetical protein
MAQDMNAFMRTLLSRLGAPITPQNLSFLSGWQRWEGGWNHNNADYNPLNTTSDFQGAVGDINSVGVTRYNSFDNGVNATAKTLQNGRYGDILAALNSGNPYKAKPVSGLSTWLSGSATSPAGARYASKVLGTKVDVPQGAGATGATGETPEQEGQGMPAVNAAKKLLTPAGNGRDSLRMMMLSSLLSSGQNKSPLDGVLQALIARQAQGAQNAPYGNRGTGSTPTRSPQQSGGPVNAPKGSLLLPMKWKGTHNTDGLTDSGRNTAIDIMGQAGQAVVAPFDGVVEKWGSAQGGESMYLRAANGKRYWLGHVDDSRIKAGTRFKAGQVIAHLSDEPPGGPHAHWDWLS